MTDGTDDRPLFTYGTLKPDQLAYRRIAHLIDRSEPATLPGYALCVRDGLPGLKVESWGRVRGFLLYPHPDTRAELFATVERYEPDSLYTKPQGVRAEAEDGRSVPALTLLMQRPEKGSPVEWPDASWSCADDPLFRYGLPEMIRELDRAKRLRISPDGDDPHFWQVFVPTLGAFLALCGVLERYLTLSRERDSTAQHLRDLGASEAGLAAVAGVQEPDRSHVFRTDDIKKSQAWSPENAWTFWYQVRSNAVHRGKAAFRDYELLATSAEGLSQALSALLGSEIPGLAARWEQDARHMRQ